MLWPEVIGFESFVLEKTVPEVLNAPRGGSLRVELKTKSTVSSSTGRRVNNVFLFS